MKCTLCKKAIDNYSVDFHQLKIDEKHLVDICNGCIDKIIKWQGKKYAVLFPTSFMKKRFGGKK
ncbi:MAG: hypothetical protein WCJ94_02350 [bacterium]